MRRAILFGLGILSCGLTLGAGRASAEIKLPGVFSEHMVLQRGQAVPVWGEAKPGEMVTVKFRNQKKTASADAKGKWLVKLDPMTAGGPDSLIVSGSNICRDRAEDIRGGPDRLIVSGSNTVTIADVLVGEVWVGSGQSNMEFGCGYFAAGDAVLARLMRETNTQIRLLPAATRSWSVATPESIKSFSALLFAFGTALQKDLNVPVGLMLGAVGGTPSGFWVTKEMLAADLACQAVVAKAEAAAPFAPRQQKYEQDLAKYKVELAKWEELVAAAKSQATQAVTQASLPPNSVLATPPEKKSIPAKPAAPVPPIRPGDASGQVGHLYETYIQPLQPYAIRGVLWDQGESNTALQGLDQFTTMGALIKGWRRAWGVGEFPFLYVQKPSGGGCAWDPTIPMLKNADPCKPLPANVPDNGETVEMFIKIMTYPKTAMVTSSDLGAGLHPVNKSGYGQRAAAVALGMVYGRPHEYYGPLYDSHKIEGNKVRVSFTHVGQGLAFKNGDQLQGFAVAGADKVFHWATATIDGDAVVLLNDKVTQPVHVRYAWANGHAWANLFNKDRLPAIPFRTDQ